MYRCPECGSIRLKETVKTKGQVRTLTIRYEAGCVLKIELINGSWQILDWRCLGYIGFK